MKNPASRNVRGRSPACSVCKSLGHRIEKCPHPAAKEILKLRKENSVLKKQSKRKVLRQEKKWRKAPKLDKEYRKKASALYKGKPAARLPSPAEIRRKQKHALDVSLNLPTTENTAASWLLDRQWIRSPTVCSECDRHVFSDLVWSQDRPPHWRCKHCGVRVKIYDLSIFTGLRVSPCELVKLIGLYVSSNLAHYPSVPDFVQVQREIENIVFHCEVFFFTITSLIIARPARMVEVVWNTSWQLLECWKARQGKTSARLVLCVAPWRWMAPSSSNFTCLLTICGMQTKFRRLTSLVNVKVNDFRNRLLAILWFWEHRCEETRQLRYMCLDPMCLGCKGFFFCRHV